MYVKTVQRQRKNIGECVMSEFQHLTILSNKSKFNSNDIFHIAKSYFKFDLALRKWEYFLNLKLKPSRKESKKYEVEPNEDYILDSAEQYYIDKYKSFYDNCCHRIRSVLSKHYANKKVRRNYAIDSNDVKYILQHHLYRFFIKKSLEINYIRKQELQNELAEICKEEEMDKYREELKEKVKRALRKRFKELSYSANIIKTGEDVIEKSIPFDKRHRKTWYKRISADKKSIIIKSDLERINTIIKELEEIKASNYTKQIT